MAKENYTPEEKKTLKKMFWQKILFLTVATVMSKNGTSMVRKLL